LRTFVELSQVSLMSPPFHSHAYPCSSVAM